MLKKLLSGAAMLTLLASSAFAQTTPASGPVNAPAKAPTEAQKVIPIQSNVIVVDLAYVQETSEAGKDMAKKLTAIYDAMNKEIAPDADALTADIKALQNTPASELDTEAFQQRKQAVTARQKAFEAKNAKLSADFQATAEDAKQKYTAILIPAIQQTLVTRNATVMQDASTVIIFNPGVDATPDLIDRLNATSKTIAVTRIQAKPPAGQGTGQASGAGAPPASGPLPKKPATPGGN